MILKQNIFVLKKMNFQTLALMACLFFFVGPHVMAGPSYPPRIGELHPDFVLPRIDNHSPVSLSQFRGKKLLLIHFASW